MKNKRLIRTFTQAIGKSLNPGAYLLDAYNDAVITKGVSFTITTRISASAEYFVLEVYDRDS